MLRLGKARLKNEDGSLLRLVSTPVPLAFIVVLHLEFKLSHILPIGFVILAEHIKFHNGMMQNFDNHCHSFLAILNFLYNILGLS